MLDGDDGIAAEPPEFGPTGQRFLGGIVEAGGVERSAVDLAIGPAHFDVAAAHRSRPSIFAFYSLFYRL